MLTSGTAHFAKALMTLVTAVAAIFLIGGDKPSNAGIQGSGRALLSSYGRITGLELGLLKMQGIEYATARAQVRINDVPASELALKLGQVVRIEGTLNADGTTATATRIAFGADVQGPVTQINAAEGTFTVLGQTVRVTDATLFDEGIQPAGIEGLVTGTSVQVSGFANSAGEWLASRIDTVLDTSSLRVRGTIEHIDRSAQTFQLNALTVDYSAATPTGPFAAGATAKVLGFTVSPDGVLVASSVSASNGLDGMAQNRAALEGIVTSFTSTADFSVNGQRVITDASTRFVGRGAAALVLNSAVEVIGLFDASAALVATQVVVR
jgi:hypothetical protein